jgi:hypothetical protein
MRAQTLLHFVVGIMALLTFSLLAEASAQLRSPDEFENLRAVVQRTQDDLGQVRSQGLRNEKERERIDNARKHLSDFDRNLSEDKFDEGRLDSAIDDVKNVLENNTLEARDRDALTKDLADLRRARELRGE